MNLRIFGVLTVLAVLVVLGFCLFLGGRATQPTTVDLREIVAQHRPTEARLSVSGSYSECEPVNLGIERVPWAHCEASHPYGESNKTAILRAASLEKADLHAAGLA